MKYQPPMSKINNQKHRFRSVVITIQNLPIFNAINWDTVPRLERVTMQLEDKDTSGEAVSKCHFQAYLEFTDQVTFNQLRNALPGVHIPTKKEVEDNKAKFGILKPAHGRNYCSNPVKRVANSPVMIWENGSWIDDSYIKWLSAKEVTPVDDHPVDSIFNGKHLKPIAFLTKDQVEEIIYPDALTLSEIGNLSQDFNIRNQEDLLKTLSSSEGDLVKTLFRAQIETRRPSCGFVSRPIVQAGAQGRTKS